MPYFTGIFSVLAFSFLITAILCLVFFTHYKFYEQYLDFVSNEVGFQLNLTFFFNYDRLLCFLSIFLQVVSQFLYFYKFYLLFKFCLLLNVSFIFAFIAYITLKKTNIHKIYPEFKFTVILKNLQAFINNFQEYILLSVISWVFFFSAQIYPNTLILVSAWFLWILFFAFCFFLQKIKFHILKYCIGLSIFARLVLFLMEEGPWNSLAVILLLFLYFSLRKSFLVEEVKNFSEKVKTSQTIVSNHYSVELQYFKAIKTESILFLMVCFNFHYFIGCSIVEYLGNFPEIYLKIFIVFKYINNIFLGICFLIDAKIILFFNVPTPVDKFSMSALGISFFGLYYSYKTYDDAANSAAVSTKEHPGDDPSTQRRQMKINGFTSPTKEGNIIGCAIKALDGGRLPYLKPGTKEIDVIKSLDYLQKGLDEPAKAKAASYMVGVPCVSRQESLEESKRLLQKKEVEARFSQQLSDIKRIMDERELNQTQPPVKKPSGSLFMELMGKAKEKEKN